MEKYLIDTNVFLEIILGQDKKEKCKKYLNDKIGRLYISDFSFHSIGVILFRLGSEDKFNDFIEDVLPRINLIGLPAHQYKSVSLNSKNYKLDFDDSYQSSIAQFYDLTISTIDKDFKKIQKSIAVDFIT